MSQLSEPVSIEAPLGAVPTGIMCVSVSATSEKALELVLGQSLALLFWLWDVCSDHSLGVLNRTSVHLLRVPMPQGTQLTLFIAKPSIWGEERLDKIREKLEL